MLSGAEVQSRGRFQNKKKASAENPTLVVTPQKQTTHNQQPTTNNQQLITDN
jgi:hypothetical protein